MMFCLTRACMAALLIAVLSGCVTQKPEPPAPAMPTIPPKKMADVLKGTIWEHVDLANTQPLRVSGYGLVVNLSGTGDTRAPNTVREYMIKQMQKHGFGNINVPGYGGMGPEQVLNDKLKRTAIVRVDGFIPPGSRKNQLFDVQVSALENSNTTSLHRGILYATDLGPRGADPLNPGSPAVNPWARVSGPIFINPTHALEEASTLNSAQKLSLRAGVIMGRGINMEDRPLVLKLRAPDRRIARLIERRIQDRFQDSRVASMQNESDINLYVPPAYADDWERFVGVVTHLYFNPSNDFAVLKARNLVEIAEKEREKAPLGDFTYCWEAMGAVILPEIRKLYGSDNPDVTFAAARAGAFLGDSGAQEILGRIARQKENAFQLSAVRVLGQLPRNARVAGLLHELLDGDQLLPRIEAYRAMLQSEDTTIYSRSIQEKFILDIVPSQGPPIIYVTRIGKPRIALIGQPVRLATPILLLEMQNHFSVASDPQRPEIVNIFYRGGEYEPEVSGRCPTDLGVVLARLGGDNPSGEGGRFNFCYGDIVGILQRLSARKLIVPANPPAGTQIADVRFEMQTLPDAEDPILSAPPIIADDQQRPTTTPVDIEIQK